MANDPRSAVATTPTLAVATPVPAQAASASRSSSASILEPAVSASASIDLAMNLKGAGSTAPGSIALPAPASASSTTSADFIYSGQAMGLMRQYYAAQYESGAGTGPGLCLMGHLSASKPEAAPAPGSLLVERLLQDEDLRERAAQEESGENDDQALIGALKTYVTSQVRSGAEALVSKAKERLEGRPVPRKLLRKLLALQKHLAGVPGPTAKFWHERSTKWVDCMMPEGRKWLELAMPSSLLGRVVDFSWALHPDVRLEEILEHQILLDLPRTFPGIDYFDDTAVLETMQRVLRAIGLALPDIGYVQGLNFVVGYAMLHTKSESAALRLSLELLANPRYNLRSVFVEDLPGLRKHCETLQCLLRDGDPSLFAHLEAIAFDDMYFSYQWLCTLFAYTMPFDALVHVWDLFFEKGWQGFYAVALTLIQDNRAALLEGDFEEAFATMKSAAANPRQDFHERARNWQFSVAQKQRIAAAVTSLQ